MLKYQIYFFLLLFSFPGCVHSQTGDAEIIEYNTTCRIENSALTVSTEFKIRINNKSGLEYAVFEIPYRKGEKLSLDDPWIEDSKGREVRKLRNKDIETDNATQDALYRDYFVKKFSLQHNEFPYIIHLSYSREVRNFLSICDWTPVYNRNIPVLKARLRVEVPAGYPVRIYKRGIADQHYKVEGDYEVYEWTGNYLQQIPDEIYSPSLTDLEPRILVNPEKFNYGVDGELKDWNTFGNWAYRLNNGLDDLPDPARESIRELVRNIKSDTGKVRAIYHYMEDHVRYIEITLNIGGMKPFPASFVADHNYGDCKALTNYLKSALSTVGIRSYYTLIAASGVPVSVSPDFPSQAFNHVILTVPFGSDTVMLENTSNINPYGYLGTGTQNRYALLVTENNSHLIKTHSLTPEEVCLDKVNRIQLNDDNSANISIDYTLRGYYFELFNQLKNLYNKHEQDQFIRKRLNIRNFEIGNWEIIKQNRDSAKLLLKLNAENPSYARNFGPFRMLENFDIGIPSFESPSQRTLPLLIPYPYFIRDSSVYKDEKGIAVESMPADTVILSKYGRYSRKSMVGGGILSVKRELLIRSGDYPLSEYESFYRFIMLCRREEAQKLLVK